MPSAFVGWADWFSNIRRTIQMDGTENCGHRVVSDLCGRQGGTDLLSNEHKDAMFINFQAALEKHAIFHRKYGVIQVRLQQGQQAESGTNRPCKKEAIR